ncbi:MAG TPA: polysaccharide deacetylase family protein [Fimbriimonas sp.]|nr:polysaccharide deacetylase family protein [Fimbriimonas sp.]
MKPIAVAAGAILLMGTLAVTTIIRPRVYHGSLVNTATEQRQDRWWQQARREIESEPPHMIHLAMRRRPDIIYRGNSEDKVVALTFDDGPHPEKAEELLNLLRQMNVKATFFVVGKMVERHPEIVRMEASEGHEIGNHSFSHVNLSKIPEEDVEVEYRACQDLLKQVIGHGARYCRPPGGQTTPAVMRAAANCAMSTAMWSDDPKDYANPGADVIQDRVLDHLSNGAIILLHEGVDETMRILPRLVTELRSEGYRFVTMSQLEATLKNEREERQPTSVARLATFSRRTTSAAIR